MIHTFALPAKANLTKLVELYDDHNPHSRYIRKVGVHAEALVRYLTPTLSNLLGKPLHPSHILMLKCHQQQETLRHLDRRTVEFVCDIVLEQDASWSIQFHMGSLINPVTVPYKMHHGMLYEGSTAVHGTLEPYTGKRIVYLTIAYATTPTNMSFNLDESLYIDALGELNLQPDDFMGHQRVNFAPQVLELPLTHDDFMSYREIIRDGVGTTVINEVMNKSCYYQTKIAEVSAQQLNATYVNSQSMGFVFNNMHGTVRYDVHPMDDLCVLFPLDEESSQTGVIFNDKVVDFGLGLVPSDVVSSTGHSNTIRKIAYNQGLLFAGHPNTFRFDLPTTNDNTWAMMPYRFYDK